jgi:Mg2+ and Co2+ transporter CorA
MTPVARTARNMLRALQQAREGMEARELIELRDTAGELERSSELTVADAQNALEYLETKAAEEQTVLAKKAGDAQHRLNLIAALFFPVTALGSILGTNMHTGLEGHPPWVFWIVFVAAFATGFAVRGSVTR